MSMLYLLLSHMVDDNRNDEASNGADTVRQSHKNRSVSRRNIQMIDVISRNGKAAACHPQGHFYCCHVLQN